MEHLKQVKEDFGQAFNALPEARRQEIADYYGTKPLTALVVIMRECRYEAVSLMDYADRHGYGLGEIGYNINDRAKEFGEEASELEKPYARLLRAFIEAFDETKSI